MNNAVHSMSSGTISGNIPTSPYSIFMKFYQLLQLPFKLGSVEFQLQIINGSGTSISKVEVKFVAEGLLTINSKMDQPYKLTCIKFGVPTKLCELTAIIILLLLKICPDLYCACPK